MGCRNSSLPHIITQCVTKEMSDTAKPRVSGVSRSELLGMELCQQNDSSYGALPRERAEREQYRAFTATPPSSHNS